MKFKKKKGTFMIHYVFAFFCCCSKTGSDMKTFVFTIAVNCFCRVVTSLMKCIKLFFTSLISRSYKNVQLIDLLPELKLSSHDCKNEIRFTNLRDSMNLYFPTFSSISALFADFSRRNFSNSLVSLSII